jgi:hypothetical protein
MSGIKEKISNTIDKMLPGHHKSTVGNATSLDNTGTGHLSSPVVGKHTGTGIHGTGTGVHGTGTGTGPLASAGTDLGTGSRMGGATTGTTNTTTGRMDNLGSTAEYGATGVGHGTHGTRGQTATAAGGGACISEKEIIDSKTFTKTVDEEVLIEKKKYELEHRPRQEEYVVETRKVGERRIPGAATEIVGTDAREVERRDVAAPRGDRTVIVEGVDVPASEMRQETIVDKHPTGHHHHHQQGNTAYGTASGKQL